MLDSSSLPSLPSAGVSRRDFSEQSHMELGAGCSPKRVHSSAAFSSVLNALPRARERWGCRALAPALAPLSARRCSPPPLSTEASPFFFLPACRGSSCCCHYSCSTVDCWLKSGEFKKQPLSHLMLQRLRRAPGFFRLDGAAAHNMCITATLQHFAIM